MGDQFLSRAEAFKMDGHISRSKDRLVTAEKVIVHVIKSNKSFVARTMNFSKDFMTIQTESLTNCAAEEVAIEFAGSDTFKNEFLRGQVVKIKDGFDTTKIVIQLNKSSRKFKEAFDKALSK